jgi:hypothetical protein
VAGGHLDRLEDTADRVLRDEQREEEAQNSSPRR